MHLARVIGTVVASRKDAGLSGMKLLLIQPLRPDRSAHGKAIVAVDSVGSGVGELVSVHVIPRPHGNLEDILPIGKAAK